jgi:hypothetical protein
MEDKDKPKAEKPEFFIDDAEVLEVGIVPVNANQAAAEATEEEVETVEEVTGEETPAEEAEPETAEEKLGEETKPEKTGEEEEPGEKPAEKKPEEKPEPHDSKGVEKRIGKLTARLRDAERQKAALEARVVELEKSKTTPDLKEPKEEDFDTQAAFLKAQVKWEMSQEKAEVQKKETEKQAKVAYDEYIEKRDAMVEDGKEKFKDFAAVCLKEPKDGGPDFSNSLVISAILETKKQAEITYYLAKHPDLLDDLNDEKKPFRIAIEIGKIEEKLSKPKTENKVSKSPKPPANIPRGTAVTTEKTLEKATTQAEFVALRKKQKETGG